jgi:hypothetical protein
MKKDEKKSDFYLTRALSADDKFVFPYRNEYEEILKWADHLKPEWKTKYYSALFYWSKSDTVTASKYFDECGDLPVSYSFYLTRASFRKQRGINEETDLQKAMKYGSQEWRPYHQLHSYYLSCFNYDKAFAVSQSAFKKFPGSYIIKFDHAMSMLYTGKYEECIILLKNTEILPYEGAGYSRIIWRQANLLEAIRLINSGKLKDAKVKIALARSWPENLGVGRPYSVDEYYENLLDAVCILKSGKNVNTENLRFLISQMPVLENSKLSSRDPELLINEGIHKLIDSAGIK